MKNIKLKRTTQDLRHDSRSRLPKPAAAAVLSGWTTGMAVSTGAGAVVVAVDRSGKAAGTLNLESGAVTRGFVADGCQRPGFANVYSTETPGILALPFATSARETSVGGVAFTRRDQALSCPCCDEKGDIIAARNENVAEARVQ